MSRLSCHVTHLINIHAAYVKYLLLLNKTHNEEQMELPMRKLACFYFLSVYRSCFPDAEMYFLGGGDVHSLK